MYTSHTIDPHPGNPAPFLYTPTSLLSEHCVLTDVQKATGRNGHQWITCRSGEEGTRPKIWMGSELVVNSSTVNSATIWLGTQHPNGLYHCLSGQSQREYFSLFYTNSGTKYVRMCHTKNALSMRSWPYSFTYCMPNSLALWDNTLSEFVQTHIIL